ncbi:hypothetical protein SRHO_G00118220 [Serrasalmus rhombeus]
MHFILHQWKALLLYVFMRNPVVPEYTGFIWAAVLTMKMTKAATISRAGCSVTWHLPSPGDYSERWTL